MQDFNSRTLRYTALQTALRTNGGNRYGAIELKNGPVKRKKR